MTNREKYAEQILDIVCEGSSVAVDVKTLKPVDCTEIRCRECKFEMNGIPCGYLRKQWCNAENTEPIIDWSEVSVDTPILVRDNKGNEWLRRYFAKYEDGLVCAWTDGANSWSVCNKDSNTIGWKYAKLAEESEQR